MSNLTAKQRAFVVNKAAGVQNRDAAIAAGYAVAAADVTAAKLLKKPAIVSAIKAATKAQGVDIDSGQPSMPSDKYADAMSFLVDVMNHTKLPIAQRADAAKQLLPYHHARIGEAGKKEKAKDRAHALVGGRAKFAPKGAPQLRVVPND